MRLLLGCLLVLLLATGLDAGRPNKKLAPGHPAPTFADLPGVDDKKYSLADFKKKDVVVLVLTCNHCPVAVAYEDRLIALAKKYASEADGKVAFVAVSVSKLEADGLPKMKERAKAKEFPFPYLHDESQKLASDLGATVTPEVVVFNKDRKVAYLGAIDDSFQANKVRVKYLENAIKALLDGDPVPLAETRPRGSPIRFDKK